MSELRTVIDTADVLASLASNDKLLVLDKSDTTGTGGGAEGTPKSMLPSVLATHLFNSPTLVTPNLGTPSALVATNATGTAAGLTAGAVSAGAVTLAMLADLAQDQFIGRTTASTGVPQTATITAAARTVLDDTTVGAMLTTLGGQPLDAELTALAALDPSAGLVEQTGAAAFTKRLIGATNSTDVPTRGDGDSRWQTLSLKDAANGYPGLSASSLISPAQMGSGASITTKFLRGDGTWQTIAASGDALTSGTLAQFAATTSAELRGVLSDETGAGAAVFAESPTLVTPALGVATATSINKVALTAPATSATLTIADGKTLTASNTLTLVGTDGTVMTFPSTSATIARRDAAQAFTGIQTFGAAGTTQSIIIGGATSLMGFSADPNNNGDRLYYNYNGTRHVGFSSSSVYFAPGTAGGVKWTTTSPDGLTYQTAVQEGAAGRVDITSGTAGAWRDMKVRKHFVDATNTAAATTGNQTINKAAGTVNIAAAGTTVTVTCDQCTAASIVLAVVRTNDSTAVIKNVVPGSGSFVINMDAAVTLETSIGFVIVN